MENKMRFMATAAFGLEGIVARELRHLHADDVTCENGRVLFSGDVKTGADANMWLRCADRVFLIMGTFRAVTFEELFQGVKSLPWAELLPKDANFPVSRVKSHGSVLFSLRDIQSVGKKAMVEAMKAAYHETWFPETGAVFPVEIAIKDDMVTVAVDMSGSGLHRRGWRPIVGEAPLRETLAAALVQIARYRGDEPLWDPMCGTGTLCIEAAMDALNIAPGLFRHFACENWPLYTPNDWREYRSEARDKRRDKQLCEIVGSDIDPKAVAVAQKHCAKAGLTKEIKFYQADIREAKAREGRGLVLSNPPYGERLLDEKAAQQLARETGEILSDRLPDYRVGILSGLEDYPKFYGTKPVLNRKLYNAKLKCYFYLFDPLGKNGGKNR